MFNLTAGEWIALASLAFIIIGVIYNLFSKVTKHGEKLKSHEIEIKEINCNQAKLSEDIETKVNRLQDESNNKYAQINKEIIKLHSVIADIPLKVAELIKKTSD